MSRLENEAVPDRMQAWLAERPDVLSRKRCAFRRDRKRCAFRRDRRRETTEHPFGTIKQRMNQGAFLMRGLEKVRAEFSPTALACNLRQTPDIVGFSDLMAAVAA